MWKPASQPPNGKPALWSFPVVCMTNLGNVFMLSYFHASEPNEPGCWQRPRAFHKEEQVEFWIETPVGSVHNEPTPPHP